MIRPVRCRLAGRIWHREHFTCTICKTAFEDGNFFLNENDPYCKEHYLEHFGKKCAACSEFIMEARRPFLHFARLGLCSVHS